MATTSILAGPPAQTGVAAETSSFMPVQQVPANTFRSSFSRAVAAGADTTNWTTVATGSGMAISQSSGNLVMTCGTTANSESIVRSKNSFHGDMNLRAAVILSQRIVNQNFVLELVDVIGDALAYTMNSATSLTVTVPTSSIATLGGGTGITAANVGQSMHLGCITGIAVAIGGRYAIASVSTSGANTLIAFTVAGFTASGSGTLSLFGFNYNHIIYNGTTATAAAWGVGRNGWAAADTTLAINTTASPGHIVSTSQVDGVAAVQDELTTSYTVLELVQRASRAMNIPDDTVELFVQIRMLNSAAAPASTTTFTVGFVQVENYSRTNVSIASILPNAKSTGLPVEVVGAVALTATTSYSGGTAAAAAADGQANPTSQPTNAFGLQFNGTTWDRIRNNANGTTGDSGAKTATFAGATQTNYNARGAIVTAIISAVSGTTPTLTIQPQWSPDAGTTWLNYGPALTAISVAGSYTFGIYPTQWEDSTSATLAALAVGSTAAKMVNAPLPRTWRLNYTIAGTTPSFTFTGVYTNSIN